MTSFVYDFKDIAQRMKGELKVQPEPVIELMPLPLGKNMLIFCSVCKGLGQDFYDSKCVQCNGQGIVT